MAGHDLVERATVAGGRTLGELLVREPAEHEASIAPSGRVGAGRGAGSHAVRGLSTVRGMLDWAEPTVRDGLVEWAREQLAALELEPVVEVEQPQSTPRAASCGCGRSTARSGSRPARRRWPTRATSSPCSLGPAPTSFPSSWPATAAAG